MDTLSSQCDGLYNLLLPLAKRYSRRYRQLCEDPEDAVQETLMLLSRSCQRKELQDLDELSSHKLAFHILRQHYTGLLRKTRRRASKQMGAGEWTEHAECFSDVRFCFECARQVEIDELIEQFEMKLASELDREIWKRLVRETRQIEMRVALRVSETTLRRRVGWQRRFFADWFGLVKLTGKKL